MSDSAVSARTLRSIMAICSARSRLAAGPRRPKPALLTTIAGSSPRAASSPARRERAFVAALGQKPSESSTYPGRGAGDQSDWVRGERQSITCLSCGILWGIGHLLGIIFIHILQLRLWIAPEGHAPTALPC